MMMGMGTIRTPHCWPSSLVMPLLLSVIIAVFTLSFLFSS